KSRAAILERPPEVDTRDDNFMAEERFLERYQSRRGSGAAHAYHPERVREFEEDLIVDDWIKHGDSVPDYMDPDLGYDYEVDMLEERPRQQPIRQRGVVVPPSRRTRVLDEEE